MIIQRTVHGQWLTNTYLIAGADAATGLLVDAGGPVAPLLEFANTNGIRLSHVFVTHRHKDHVDELDVVIHRFPDAIVMGHADEVLELGVETLVLSGGEQISAGGVEVEVLHTPGHTSGMLAYRIQDAVFTSDTLYRGSVGGVRSPGHTHIEDLRNSVMNSILILPTQTVIYPGHGDATSVGIELSTNPFVRRWAGAADETPRPCRVEGRQADALVVARDYDGGTKVWVRYSPGDEEVVGGSIVEFAATERQS